MTIRLGEDSERTPYPSHLERMRIDGETISYPIGETPSTIFIERIGPFEGNDDFGPFGIIDIDYQENESLDYIELPESEWEDWKNTSPISKGKPFTEWRTGRNKRYPSYFISPGYTLLTSWTYSKKGPIHLIEDWTIETYESLPDDEREDYFPPFLTRLPFNLD